MSAIGFKSCDKPKKITKLTTPPANPARRGRIRPGAGVWDEAEDTGGTGAVSGCGTKWVPSAGSGEVVVDSGTVGAGLVLESKIFTSCQLKLQQAKA